MGARVRQIQKLTSLVSEFLLSVVLDQLYFDEHSGKRTEDKMLYVLCELGFRLLTTNGNFPYRKGANISNCWQTHQQKATEKNSSTRIESLSGRNCSLVFPSQPQHPKIKLFACLSADIQTGRYFIDLSTRNCCVPVLAVQTRSSSAYASELDYFR